jgi:hypothetical protein
MPPTTIDPTYHTAIWLEDANGVLIKTLYVSQELSAAEYKMGNVCPDWVKKAQWDKAPKSEVDAVTSPTPSVGSGSRGSDLGQMGVAPGTSSGSRCTSRRPQRVVSSNAHGRTDRRQPRPRNDAGPREASEPRHIRQGCQGPLPGACKMRHVRSEYESLSAAYSSRKVRT